MVSINLSCGGTCTGRDMTTRVLESLQEHGARNIMSLLSQQKHIIMALSSLCSLFVDHSAALHTLLHTLCMYCMHGFKTNKHTHTG